MNSDSVETFYKADINVVGKQSTTIDGKVSIHIIRNYNTKRVTDPPAVSTKQPVAYTPIQGGF